MLRRMAHNEQDAVHLHLACGVSLFARLDATKTDCYELETSAGGSSFHNLCSFFNISTEKPFCND